MSEALKPCPFCGGEAEIIDVESGENAGGSCVSCQRCMACSKLEFGAKETFVDAWNTRADLSVAMVAAAYEDAARYYIDESGPGAWDFFEEAYHGIKAQTPDDAKAALASLIEDAQRKAVAKALKAAADPESLTIAYLKGADDERRKMKAAQVACVKPLTWHNFDAYVFWAEAVCGTYHVECHNGLWRAELRFRDASHIVYEIDDFETAIQACCDDYNEHILSALTMRSEAEVKMEAWNEAIEACAKEYNDGSGPDVWDFFKTAYDAIRALKRETGQC